MIPNLLTKAHCFPCRHITACRPGTRHYIIVVVLFIISWFYVLDISPMVCEVMPSQELNDHILSFHFYAVLKFSCNYTAELWLCGRISIFIFCRSQFWSFLVLVRWSGIHDVNILKISPRVLLKLSRPSPQSTSNKTAKQL